jgi:type IV pilus assembly protein PilM
VRSTKSPSWLETNRPGALARLLGFGRITVPPAVFALEEAAAGARLSCARFERTPGGLAFVFLDSLPIPEAALLRGPLGASLRDGAAFAAPLATLLQRAGKGLKDATLLVPDAWLRTVACESGSLPTAAAARDEVLRWKLRRLVPYRVEDLRLGVVRAATVARQQEPMRLLLGFAGEAVLASFEAAFAAEGVHIGCVSTPSLALAAGLRAAPAGPGVEVEVTAGEEDYAICLVREGEIALHRYRSWSAQVPAEAREALVRGDLARVANFVTEELPGAELGRVLLHRRAGARDDAAAWLAWLGEALGRGAAALDSQHLPLAVATLPAAWKTAAPLVGGACLEVA